MRRGRLPGALLPGGWGDGRPRSVAGAMSREREMIDDSAVLAALRGQRSVAEVCRAAGVSEAEFAAARDAFLRRRLPPAEARLAAAVAGPVEILRDRAGVPHIYAGRTADLYFGLGFVMGQDRLWQMDRLRRRALGRQAEVLGPQYVASDLIHLTVGIDRLAAAEVGRLDEATRAIVDAFVRGINRAIEAYGRNLPPEFAILDYEPAPFTVADVIAIARGIWWSLNGRLENLVVAEAARLLPSEELRAAYLTPEAPEHRIVPPGSPYPAGGGPLPAPNDVLAGMGDHTGSNNWAVAGWRTPAGRALLCSDPHQAFWVPSSWYEYAVHGPEDDAAGAGHPGMPGLWWGSNGDIAWGITNNAASTRDLYQEEVDPADPRRYRDGDGWRTFDETDIVIPVRGGAPARHTRRASVRGPIVNAVLPAVAEDGDPPLALRWVGMEHLDDLRATIAIGRARDWPAFRAALRDWSVPIFNFIYADRTGRVGYQCAGRVPVRGRVVRGYREANNPADRWQGYVPYDAMPRLEDPPRGYVASANQRVVPDDYPYPFYGAYAAGHRGTRIQQAIEGAARFDRAAGIALQNDTKNCRAERLCPPLVERLAVSADPDVRRLRELLGGWDYRYTLDSPAPIVFETFMHAWQRRVAAEYFPERLLALVQPFGGVAARLIERDDLAWFAGGTARALEETARAAVAEVRARFGDDPAGWAWGPLHQAYWRHPLTNDAAGPAFDIGPAPVDGSGDTVRNTGAGTPPYAATSGAEYRLVVDFAEPDHFLAVQNIGNSGQPGSPHYADQFGPWLRGEYHTVHLRRAAVEHALESKTLLEPAG
jgi:penicillin amidase